MFLIEKYTEELRSGNNHIASQVAELDINQNLIVMGGSCSGKKMVMNAILNRRYGSGVIRTQDHEYVISNYGSNSVQVKLQQSNFHIVFNPNNSALDRYVIQEVIVNFCRTSSLHYFNTGTAYKTVVIMKGDLLSEQAQYSLRRIMEDNAHNARFIIIARNLCNFIEPIQSRCMILRLPCPTREDVGKLIGTVCEKEEIDPSCSDGVLSAAGRDSRKAMWMLECERHGIEYKCHWEALVDSIVADIFSGYGKTIKNITDTRDRLGKLFITNIDSESIVLYMSNRILQRLSDPKKYKDPFEMASKVSEVLARYDSRLKNATRYILHFEGLISSLAALILRAGA